MDQWGSRKQRRSADRNGTGQDMADEQWTMPMKEDFSISPWLEQDVPPTPPPKPMPIAPQQQSTSRKFGSSFSSLVSSFARSNGGSATLPPLPPESRYDDSDSFRGLSISSSSTTSHEIRKKKSSTFLAKLKPQSSKQHLRSESSDSEHPSLRPPVPQFPPQQYNNSIFNMSTTTIAVSIPATITKAKRSLVTKKPPQIKQPPAPPPKKDEFGDFQFSSGIVDLTLDEVEGFVDINRASAGVASAVGNIAIKSDGARDHDIHPEFSNPFPSGSASSDRHPWPVTRKDSNPLPPDSFAHREGSASLPSSTWAIPPSWSVVQKPGALPTDSSNSDISDGSNSDDDATTDHLSCHTQPTRKMSDTTVAPTSFSTSKISLETSVDLPNQHGIIVHLPSGREHLVHVGLETTVASLTASVIRDIEIENEKRVQESNGQPLEPIDGGIQLYLKEQMRERMLGPNERPAAIVKLRLEQAGYTLEDGIQLIRPDNLHILHRFVYKNELLAGEAKIDLGSYEIVNLSARSLRTIPPIVHQNAEQIVTLKLSRNPMLEIPLDFIQSCLSLSTLQLTHMYMKKVPESVQYCLSLQTLDISSNAIRDLENTVLTGIPELYTIEAQNNRLYMLPSHFGRLPALTNLNISNNKFRTFPLVLTEIASLRLLDISFNMITELPAEIGLMTALRVLIIIGNQVSKFPEEMAELVHLRALDVRRNNISDLSIAYRLPQIQTLSADHNSVSALELSLGPRMTTLVASHNDIEHLSLRPPPAGRPSYALRSLNLSYAKLSSIDDLILDQLPSLRSLKLDHNSLRSLPDTLGDLKWLETLSCSDNKLDALPATLGKLQKLETLDAHNNNINELPQTLWNCASLTKINFTSNFITAWPELPTIGVQALPATDGSLSSRAGQPSRGSSRTSQSIPSLAYSLEKLYIGENLLTDIAAIAPLMVFKELRVLNMSFNEINDLPPCFFRNLVHLEELYLSGNKLISIPVEHLPQLKRLSTIFLNGNKLQTLPQELGKVDSLRVLDAGSNFLKYNINNWEFDWNWNFNVNLKYLNLSGNDRLQIKPPRSSSIRTSKDLARQPMSGFKNLTQLRVLGLMDVTITTYSRDRELDIPDEHIDRRVRTSLSTVCKMGYGISDSLGKNDHLTMLDLVHEFQGPYDEAIFAMFGRTHPPRGLQKGWSPNFLTKFLHSNFVKVFKEQLAAVNSIQARNNVPPHLRREGIPKALTWTFLKLNQDFCELSIMPDRKNSFANKNLQALRDAQPIKDTQSNKDSQPKPVKVTDTEYFRTGVAAVVVYLLDRTLYAANVGDALAVVSRQGIGHEISRKHHPFDRTETARIRAAEGYISPSGLVNDQVKVSRAFGYYHVFPPINARPDIFVYDLSELDEFVIIANRGLWDYIPYQTAVEIVRNVARTQRPDPMLAAQKLRDFAISYGADGSTMIMVVWVADLYNTTANTLTPELIVDPRRTKPGDRGVIHDEGGEIAAPVGHITLVFTDIRNSTHLWEVNPGMKTAIRMHNTLLRRQLRLCGGYEVKTEGDSFMCSFPTTLAAVWWCLSVQELLLHEPWPLEILECEDGKPIYDASGRLIARGLSVRMGIHSGTPLCEPDLITHRMDYFGPMVNRSARIQSSAQGGQIACSQDIVKEINEHILQADGEANNTDRRNQNAIDAIRNLGVTIMRIGEVKLKGIELPEILFLLYPSGLQERHDLKETSADLTTSGSRVQFSAAQLVELGILCLRIEALASNRILKPLSERKQSVRKQSVVSDTTAEQEEVDNPKYLYCDPKLLLPPISDRSTDAELMRVLDSLVLRIVNAVNTLGEKNGLHKPPPRPAQKAILSTLTEDGGLDAQTLQYIASLLERC